MSDLDLRLKKYREAVNCEAPGVPWLVEPVLPEGTRVLFYGEYRSMKSWLLIDLGVHLAAGQPWLGSLPTRQASVLYIDEEMPARTLHRRVKRLGRSIGVETSDLPLWLSNRPGLTITPQKITQLCAMLGAADVKPQVIIIEAVRRVLVGDENSAEDVARMWNTLTPLARAGVTVILSHHKIKPQGQYPRAIQHTASGSGDFIGGCDVAIAVARAPNSNTATLTVVKNRDAEEPAPFNINIAFMDDAHDGAVTISSEGHGQTVAPGDWARIVLLKHLERVGSAKVGECLERIVANKVSEETGKRIIKTMLAAGRLVKDNGELRVATLPVSHVFPSMPLEENTHS